MGQVSRMIDDKYLLESLYALIQKGYSAHSEWKNFHYINETFFFIRLHEPTWLPIQICYSRPTWWIKTLSTRWFRLWLTSTTKTKATTGILTKISKRTCCINKLWPTDIQQISKIWWIKRCFRYDWFRTIQSQMDKRWNLTLPLRPHWCRSGTRKYSITTRTTRQSNKTKTTNRRKINRNSKRISRNKRRLTWIQFPKKWIRLQPTTRTKNWFWCCSKKTFIRSGFWKEKTFWLSWRIHARRTLSCNKTNAWCSLQR